MLRILGGKFRGRKLATPTGRNTRPTSARVREAVFDILEHSPGVSVNWSGLNVLDLYAGSGAFGLEALSRGAQSAVLVEQNPAAITALQENMRNMNLDNACTVIKAPVSAALDRLESGDRTFGLVFMDPPYRATEETRNTLGRLARFKSLARGARVVVEQSGKSSHTDKTAGQPDNLDLLTRRQWGDTEVVFFCHV